MARYINFYSMSTDEVKAEVASLETELEMAKATGLDSAEAAKLVDIGSAILYKMENPNKFANRNTVYTGHLDRDLWP